METAYELPPASLGGSAFAAQVKDGRIVPVIQFGGQSSQYLSELISAYQESFAARECIEAAAATLLQEVRHPDAVASGYFAHGLNILEWIAQPDRLPPAGYLSRSPVSQTLLFLTQVANVLRLTDRRDEIGLLFERAVSYLGYSQGVMTAVCFAMGFPGKGFADRVVDFARYFFWQGVRMQQACPPEQLPAEALAEAQARNEGAPVPMAALTGLTIDEAEAVVAECNARLAPEARIYRGLTNTWNRVVLSGPTRSLLLLRAELARREAAWSKDPLRRRQIEWQYLITSAPFHTPYMNAGLPAFRADCKRIGFRADAADLQKPVYATDDGRNLRASTNLLDDLLAMQWLHPVHWPTAVRAAVRDGVTHVVDFGPGEASVKLTGMNAEGRGVAVIAAATPAGRTIVLHPDAERIPWGEDWTAYRPRLVRVASTDRVWLDNAFTRFTKCPPIFGGGMTPTTVETPIVTAAANAGYLVEWAGGGQVTEAIWRQRLDELARDLAPGRGVVFNALFLDPYLWNLHYPKLIALKQEGHPILGLTISAGLPDVDKATEILQALNAAGIWMNAFKPGSDAMIAHFLRIADANPRTTLLMHVEGGKAGGHHSWEDIRGLITRNYAKIRRRKNVILCVGGGIAAPDEAAAWLLGTWQTYPDLPPMPVDAVFLGTRLMAVKEAKTSPQVKKYLTEVHGTHEWIRKLECKGGVTSQESQLGADVHFADNAAARAGALLDRLAGQPREAILRRKAEIIAALERTAKPYFGELAEMTYGAVLRRMCALMGPGRMPDYLPHDGPWFDATFRQRVFEWAERICARFDVPCSMLGPRTSNLEPRTNLTPVQLNAPDLFIRDLLQQYPLAATTLLHPEDIDYFLSLCRRPGKPVNFVPAIDEDVRKWYKADSLWQAHDPRYPADAVFTIPGPEAIRGITRIDEPIAEVLGAFERAVIDALEPTDARIGAVGEAPAAPAAPDALAGGRAQVERRGGRTVFRLEATEGCRSDDGAAWRRWIASQGHGPIATALKSAWIARASRTTGTRFVQNPIARLCTPRPGEVWEGEARGGRLIALRTAAWRLAPTPTGLVCEVAHRPPGRAFAALELRPRGRDRSVVLRLSFAYRPECGWAPLQESAEERAARLAVFYASVWGTKVAERGLPALKVGQVFRSEHRVTRAAIEAYCLATGEAPSDASPLNMTIVHAWGAFAQVLAACGSIAGLLDLLHLSNTFIFHGARPIGEGDRLLAELTVQRIEPRGNGMVIGVAGKLERSKECVAELGSEFFVRGAKCDVVEPRTSHLAPRTSEQVVAVPAPFDVAAGAIAAPSSAVPYAVASRDMNPIHTDAHLARLAGLDGPILHGMWTNAAILRECARHLGDGDPARLTAAQTQFTGPVRPGDALTYVVRQIGAASGARVCEATVDGPDGPVLVAQVRVREGRAAYLFTGQGSQKAGMGMEGYARCAAARAVWDEADRFCRDTYGFSILQIVKENPREILVRGESLHHPQGVLHLTQFTQVALTVLAIAQIVELKQAGCYDARAMYAGHSLGEYAALAAIGILPLTEMVSVVYHRGLTMQHYVPRDAHGVSPYGMAVVRPNMVGMSEAALQQLVHGLAAEHHGSIEVVNLNIAGEQYSVTGETRLLRLLQETLRAEEERRGVTKPSFILLEGIDVPFHSTVLRDGVPAFRKTLEACIPRRLDLTKLIDRYIPNLIAEPFRVDRAYLQSIFDATQSAVMKRLLRARNGSPEQTARAILIELLAYQFASPVQWIRTQAVLFGGGRYQVRRVIEIGPQPVLAGMAKRTLAREPLALQPPKVWHVEQDRAEVFYVREEEQAAVIASPTGAKQSPGTLEIASPPPTVRNDTASTGTAPPRQLPLPIGAREDPALPGRASQEVGGTGAAPPMHDEPLSVRDALWNLLALKLRLRPDEIQESATIEKLAGGNSARRNEILADLGAEFAVGAIDDAQNKPLGELVEVLRQRAKYAAPGPYLRVAADQAIKGSLPLSRKAIMEYLAGERLLPEGRILAVLNLLPVAVRAGDSLGQGALSPIGPAARIADETAARRWVDQLADWYGSLKGVTVPHRAVVGSQATAMVDAGALAALEEKYFGREGPLARAAHALLAASGVDPFAAALADDQELLEQNRRLALYTAALGPRFERAAVPLFDPRKSLTFSSIWNWVRRDVVEGYYEDADRLAPERIAGAADANTLATLGYFLKRARKENRPALARRLAETERAVRTGIDKPPRYRPDHGAAALVRAIAKDLPGLAPILKDVAARGLALAGRRVVITGAGPGSIAAEIVRACLAAGARVVVTTTTASPERTQWLRRLYATAAGRGAELTVLPANQGNRADLEAVIDWMAKQYGGIDACYPFGAVKELGDLTTMEPGAATATWRVLVQGVEWCIAAIAAACAKYAAPGHRVSVILPLSPNHGQFGGDGAYSESKAALEVLLQRWRSEQEAWGKWIGLIGARIGWTRGTGLMSANDAIAAAIERETGCRTFSAAEMAFLLTAVLHPKVVALAAKAPLRVDYTGGFAEIPDIAKLTRRLREETVRGSRFEVRGSDPQHRTSNIEQIPTMSLKADPHYFSFPRIPSAEEMAALPSLHHVDPASVMVIVGFGEVSPYGSARTRWEIEAGGLSIAACIELAWIMGLIRYEAEGAHVGWVDAATGEPVPDHAVRERYEETIRSHTGIRPCEPALQGFDPQSLRVWEDVQLQDDFLVPIETSEQGQRIVAKYDGQAELVTRHDARGMKPELFVQLKKGAIIKVAGASRFPRYIAGQIPSGWDATRYGIPKELVAQVDRNTLFNIVATVEAFLAAGCAPQELYDYFHPARVGNTQGGGMGGMQALTHLYRAHREGQARKGDALQETLINVVAAWVTQSFVGGYGPTVHPVGACATAVVSLDTAVNLLATNKADFVVAGGFDGYSSEGVIGFNDMEATADIDKMAAKGLVPGAMSRPNDRRRGGFVEAQGGGTLLVTRLDHAVRMGLPIYAVIGYVATHSDGIHTSIPAPGLGLLGMAAGGKASPLARALAAFGLTADDIAAVSKHDTSTNANDPNENRLHHLLHQAIGRSPGNPLLVHSQKAVLGHAKGGAGAWQANAAIQMLLTGTVPGNPNLDDVDPAMAAYPTMCFSDRPVHLGPARCKAVMFTSLGFGHVGAGALFIHPDYALRGLPPTELAAYAKRRAVREAWHRRHGWEILLGKTPAYERRTEKPYRTTEEEAQALLSGG
ncbi:MAG: SDR family NAD(P)-dependent oxidoreductase [Deltaproteobacteria bacterium]|nr:SDR family NAD(P)-dependent oxidoreductase [Deltaproteobacteria bacterium]